MSIEDVSEWSSKCEIILPFDLGSVLGGSAQSGHICSDAYHIGPILDDRLNEKNPETLKGCPQ